jgi:hypothetical protein
MKSIKSNQMKTKSKLTKAQIKAEKEAKRLKANLASRQSRLRKKMRLGQVQLTIAKPAKPSKSLKYADAPEIGSVFYMFNGACRIMVTDKVDTRGYIPTVRLDNGMKMDRHITELKDTQKMTFVKVLKQATTETETKKAA